MNYYLPIILKLADVKAWDQSEFLKKTKNISYSKLVEKWKKSIKEKFEAHLGIALALFYALKCEEEELKYYLKLVRVKKGISNIEGIIRCFYYCETNQFDEALDVLKNLPIKILKIPLIYKIKADICFFLKEYDKAEKLYKYVIEAVPDESQVYSRIGEIYFLRSNFDKAKEFFEKAIKLDEKNTMAHFYLGDIFKLEGDIKKAKMEYGICSAIDFKNNVSKMAQQKLLLLCLEDDNKNKAKTHQYT